MPEWPEARGLSASDLRWRSYLDTAPWVVSAGADIGADGLIGRKVIGKGVAVFCQVDPDRFQADEKTYFRYTRWRSTRAVAQLLANLGASFPVDSRVFHPLDTTAPRPKPEGGGAPDITIPIIARISPWETIPTVITGGRDPAIVLRSRRTRPCLSCKPGATRGMSPAGPSLPGYRGAFRMGCTHGWRIVEKQRQGGRFPDRNRNIAVVLAILKCSFWRLQRPVVQAKRVFESPCLLCQRARREFGG